MRQSSTNFWGGMANRLLGSVDLVGVASGNYVGAVAETTISQVYALMDRDMAVEERRALARDLDHLKRFPDDPRNAAIRKQVASLDKKKECLDAQADRQSQEKHSPRMILKELRFTSIWSRLSTLSVADADELRQQVVKSLGELDKSAQQQSAPRVPRHRRATNSEPDVQRLLEVLTLRDSNQIQRVAIDTEKISRQTVGRRRPRFRSGRPGDEGMARSRKKAVEQMAKSSANPEVKERAATLLQSPHYNLLPFQDARTDRQLQSAKYVLLGEDFLRKNLPFAAGAMTAAGPAAAMSLGMVNALMVTNNFYQVMTKNPVSAQPVIDAGVAYARNHPNSENASEVYRVLADAYEERGMLDQAISYHELAGSPKQKIEELKDKSAKTLLNAATKAPIAARANTI